MNMYRVYVNIKTAVHYDVDANSKEEAERMVNGYYDDGAAEELADRDETSFEIVDIAGIEL